MLGRRLSYINDIGSLSGKTIVLRASLNVPLENGKVRDRFRILRALKTLRYFIQQNARVVLISHIGRDPKLSLKPVYTALSEHLPIIWAGGITGGVIAKSVAELQNGEVLMLENLRTMDEEKNNDEVFSKTLASYGDLYVNDAFSVSHRMHASIVGVPKYIPGYFGLVFRDEITELTKTIEPTSPSLFILGGAKFETKVPLIRKYLETYDQLFVGGALANDFFKAKGYEVGKSLVSEYSDGVKDLLKNEKLILPVDVTVVKDDKSRLTTPDDVSKDETIWDAGPATIDMLSKYTNAAKTILWNGPLGNYEAGNVEYTGECARLVSESHAHTVVGGGDTIAAIQSYNLSKKFGFLSTAGGAMLLFLEHRTLPGIEAILNSHV